MSFQKYLKWVLRSQLSLICLSFLLVVSTHQIVEAKSSVVIEDSQKNTVHLQDKLISQAFLETNYQGDYYSKLREADNFYKQGNLVKVKQIQREVKPDFPPATEPEPASVDVEKLSPTAKESWLSASETFQQQPEKKKIIKQEILEPLENLVEEAPDFVPGHILLADTHFYLLSKEKKGLEVIEKASEMYPGRDDVLDKKIELLLSEGKPLEASIAAREFAYSYPDYYKSAEYEAAANEYQQQYQEKIKSRLGISTVAGAAGQVATGNEGGALELGQMLVQGESQTGQFIANGYKTELPMVTDADKLQYVDNIGQKLAQLMGRNEFAYEFNIVDEPSPNAFALPGGKIFLHTGMLQIIDSEAELGGILAHEIAHSVLSHGYQKIANKALTDTGTSILSNIIGSQIADTALQIGNVLISQEFSRDKETEADILGLRVLDAAGYSADGLYNVMAKLKQVSGESNFADSLLSSHPAPEERMRYLEELIQNRGYNRYGYEGVEQYQAMFPR